MKKLLVSLLGLSLVLALFAGCGAVKDEKQSFIDATVEATCLIFESDDLFDPALEEQTKDIFSKHGFDADDEVAMEALTTKYEEDEEVQSAILAALEECSAGIFEGLEDELALDEEVLEEEVLEEEVLEEEVLEEEVAGEEVAEEEVTEEEVAEEEVAEEEVAEEELAEETAE